MVFFRIVSMTKKTNSTPAIVPTGVTTIGQCSYRCDNNPSLFLQVRQQSIIVPTGVTTIRHCTYRCDNNPSLFLHVWQESLFLQVWQWHAFSLQGVHAHNKKPFLKLWQWHALSLQGVHARNKKPFLKVWQGSYSSFGCDRGIRYIVYGVLRGYTNKKHSTVATTMISYCSYRWDNDMRCILHSAQMTWDLLQRCSIALPASVFLQVWD